MANGTPQLDPRMTQAYKQQIRQQMEAMNLSPEEVEKLEQLFQYILMHPEDYKDIVAQAIQEDILDPGDLPEEYDSALIGAILMALSEMSPDEGEMAAPFAKGGLAMMAKKVQAQGRNGDSILAHINRKEAEMLRRMGGGATINPRTGLREFGFLSGLFKGIGKAVKGLVKGVINVGKSILSSPIGQILVPMALTAFGIPPMIGEAFGATGTAANLIGQGVIGGLTSAAAGQNPLKGALGSMAMGYAQTGGFDDILGKFGVSPATAQAWRPAVGGALSSVAQGRDPITGAITAHFGAQALNKFGPDIAKALNVNPPAHIGVQPTQTMGNASGIYLDQLSPGIQLNPTQMGITQGPGIQLDPTQIGITQNLPEWQLPTTQGPGIPAPVDVGSGYISSPNLANAQLPFERTLPYASPAAPTTTTAGFSDMLPYGAMGLAMMGSGKPQQIPQFTPGSPDQRPLMDLIGGMDPVLRDNLQRTGQLNAWMNQNWQDIQAGRYAKPRTMYAARGGALNRLAHGAGSGRDDTIPARLSDGEYVIDAESVALLGDGSTENGASKLDKMRQQLRMQKGKAFAKGQFSPAAKSPLAYIGGL